MVQPQTLDILFRINSFNWAFKTYPQKMTFLESIDRFDEFFEKCFSIHLNESYLFFYEILVAIGPIHRIPSSQWAKQRQRSCSGNGSASLRGKHHSPFQKQNVGIKKSSSASDFLAIQSNGIKKDRKNEETDAKKPINGKKGKQKFAKLFRPFVRFKNWLHSS